jgi:lipopolysaccharide/colanic/teichoic acid biosynthesis glycosyltransferase
VVAKRLFDLVVAGTTLVLSSPLLLLAAIAIKLTSKGPVLYRAERVGRGGMPFTIRKFRTMRTSRGGAESAITGVRDPRVFPVGAVLRLTKIDELPQLLDVLQGRMAIVGPRPEDPRIVADLYTAADRETLTVAPGLLSPGSIYSYTHGDGHLAGAGDPEVAYARSLLPVKLALDRVYLHRQSVVYDVRLCVRAFLVITAMTMGRRHFPFPPEMEEARRMLAAAPP